MSSPTSTAACEPLTDVPALLARGYTRQQITAMWDEARPGWRELARAGVDALNAAQEAACAAAVEERKWRCGGMLPPAVGARCECAEGAAAALLDGSAAVVWAHGGTRSERSLWASCLSLAWLAGGRTFDSVDDVDLKDELRSSFDGCGAAAVVKRYSAPGLLVVTGLGAAEPASWYAERLYQIASRRLEAGRPTAWVSPLMPSGYAALLAASVGAGRAKMTSEAMAKGAAVVECSGRWGRT